MKNTTSEPNELQEMFLQSASIQRFVRDSLGCSCPDSVFDHVVVGYPSIFELISGESPEVQLIIGSRLLISVVDASRIRSLEAFVKRRLAQGKRIRNEHGLNRFRLVLICDVPLNTLENWRGRFCEDDHIHLHITSRDDLVDGLSV